MEQPVRTSRLRWGLIISRLAAQCGEYLVFNIAQTTSLKQQTIAGSKQALCDHHYAPQMRI
jgi:hypothetical protein